MKNKIKLFVISLMISTSVISKAQVFDWAAHIGADGTQISKHVATDASGNVYVCGDFGGTVDFDPSAQSYMLTASSADVFIIKYDASGNLIWAKKVGGSGVDRSNSIQLDNNGNIYVTGSFIGTADMDPGAGTQNLISQGNEDAFILKLDNSGQHIWSKSLGGSLDDYGHAISIDASGNPIVTGLFRGTVDFDLGIGVHNVSCANNTGDGYILKLNSSGEYMWAQTFNSSNFGQGVGLITDAELNIYTIGGFRGSASLGSGSAQTTITSHGLNDIIITKHNENGDLVWAQNYGGTDVDRGYSLAIDGYGSLYAVGFFEGVADFDFNGNSPLTTGVGDEDAFVLKMDLNGNFKWVKAYGGAEGEDRARDVSVDEYGNVYVSGYFSESVDFDPGDGVSIAQSQGAEDGYMLSLNAAGDFIWKETFGGTDLDVCWSTVSEDGDIYIVGYFKEVIDLDPSTTVYSLNCNSTVNGDGFVVKWSQLTLSLNETPESSEILIYPNPNNGTFRVELEDQQEPIEVYIYDFTGRLIATEVIGSFSNHQISIAANPGNYLLMYENKGAVNIERFIVF